MNAWHMLNRLVSPLATSPRLFRGVSGSQLFIFNYHEVSDTPSHFSRDFNLNVAPQTFARQLRWMREHFNVVTPLQLLSGKFELPAAMVTFDDGFKSALTDGVAILRREKIPATIFVNMAPVQGEPFWSGVVTYLSRYSASFRRFVSAKYGEPIQRDFFLRCTKSDVDEFCRAGAVGVLDEASAYYGPFASEGDIANSDGDEIFLGNHLFNHYNAAILPLAELRQQYELNHEALSRHRNHVSFFSYPFGQPESCYNEATDTLILGLGAERIFTAFPLPNRRSSASRLHRISMSDHINTEAAFRTNCLLPAFVNDMFRKRRYSYV